MSQGGRRIAAVLPKLLGIALVIVALSYAFDSNWPVPLGDQLQAARKAAPADDPLIDSLTVRPVQGAAEPAREFTWSARCESPSFRVVLLDSQHRELAWSTVLEATTYRPEGDFARALRGRSGQSWYVVGQHHGRQVRSAACPVGPR